MSATTLFYLLVGALSLCVTAKAAPKICVIMLVENDDRVLYQCLDSLRGFADCLSITLSESRDPKDCSRTIIDEFAASSKIPTKVHLEQWKNGRQNRTSAIANGEKALKEWSIPLTDSYFVLLNPEMILKIGPSFKKEDLTESVYSTLTKSSLLDCYTYQPRLFRAAMHYTGAEEVYDTIVLNTSDQPVKLRSLFIDDQEDRLAMPAELENSILFLKKSVTDHVENHHLFYQGLRLKKLKQFEEAIHAFLVRIQKEGDSEEVWFSKYMIGECYKELNQWEHALDWYLNAFQFNPSYPEPLQKVAYYYRTHGQNDLAYLFAKHGTQIAPSASQRFFHLSPLTNYHFDEELSIAAYYTQFKADGIEACNEAILNPTTPWWVKDQTYRNLVFYNSCLTGCRYMPIELDFPLIQEGSDERYHPMNPSIQKTPDGYAVICRTVNYTQTGAKIFNTIDSNGIYRTRNFLAEYDSEFNLKSQKEIVDDVQRERLYSCSVVGLEDCRIFNYDNSSWFTCTTSDTNPTGQRQISLCKLADEQDAQARSLDFLIPLQGPDPYRCEKNWLPFVKDGEMQMVYSCHPFTVFKPNLETGACKTVLRYEPKHDFSRFRGSAGPIPFNGGYLMLVHEVIHQADFSRNYFHRFLFLDENLVVTKLSTPFIFKHAGVEFCCSMTLDHTSTQLILAIGIEDREAYLGFIDLKAVDSLLKPLPVTYEPIFK
jgi:tetratricopeptide (TPR) repeat protein